VLGCSALAAAQEPVVDEQAPSAVRRYPPSSVRTGLIGGGLGLWGLAYGIGLGCGLGWNDVPGADELAIPVAGPWIALGMTGCAPDDPDCEAILVMRGVLYALDGLVQLGGLGLAAEGVFMTTEAEAPADASATVTVAPWVTERATGLGLVGAF